MKQITRISLIACLSLLALANAANAEIKIINHGGASLPREAHTQGQSWPAASANWMQCLRTNATSVSSGRDLALRENDLGDYRKMLTRSGVRTWKGLDDSTGPTVEYGNFWHQGIQIVATNGDTFIPSQVIVDVRSFSFNNSGNFVPGSLRTPPDFFVLNYFRQVLNPDGSVKSPQPINGTVPATNFLYGGVGIGLLIADTGTTTTQERLDSLATDLWNRDYTLRYTVTVPQGSNPPVVKTWDVKRKAPATVVGQNNKIFLTDTFVGKSYIVEHSPTLQSDSWMFLETKTGTGAPIEITMTHASNKALYPKMFYRVKY